MPFSQLPTFDSNDQCADKYHGFIIPRSPIRPISPRVSQGFGLSGFAVGDAGTSRDSGSVRNLPVGVSERAKTMSSGDERGAEDTDAGGREDGSDVGDSSAGSTRMASESSSTLLPRSTAARPSLRVRMAFIKTQREPVEAPTCLGLWELRDSDREMIMKDQNDVGSTLLESLIFTMLEAQVLLNVS